jgi:hypothetical protein
MFCREHTSIWLKVQICKQTGLRYVCRIKMKTLKWIILGLLIAAPVIANLASAQDAGAGAPAYIAPGTFAYHLSTNAVARTNGISNIAIGLGEVSGFFSVGTNLALVSNIAWSPDFWLKGVTGLSATCIGFSNQMAGCAMFNGQGLATMVSPRHYLCATHMHPEGWGMIAFLDTNNVVFWRRTLQRVNLTNTPARDTSIGILDADLPSSVGFLPMLPTNYSSYLSTDATTVVQGIGMNQQLQLFSQPLTFWPAVVGWDHTRTTPFGLTLDWNRALTGGDSSNPDMVLADNQLVLVSHNHFFGGGPNYASQIPAINEQMHYLSTNNAAGSDYQLTCQSLGKWPKLGK